MKFFTRFAKAGLAIGFALSAFPVLAQSQAGKHPETYITTDKQTGCAPEAIRFKLVTPSPVNAVKWIIGKDSVKNGSAEQTYLFSEAGIYGATAVFKLPSGKDTSITTKDLVKLGRGNQPINLSVSRNYLCNGPDTISFTASAAGAAEYDWIIDGTNHINAGPKVTHRFTTAGAKTVSVRVKDSFGCYSLKTFTDVVVIANPPKLAFDADAKQGCMPLTVNFSQNTIKGSADILSWKWELPGSTQGSSSVDAPKNISYTKPGNYDVILIVTTKDGCVFTQTKKGFISVSDTLTPTFTADKKTICPGDIITYTSTSGAKADGKLVWDFPGGTVLPNSTEGQQFVRYATYGTFSANLSYKNGNCVKTTTLAEAAVVERLKADFIVDKFCNCRVPDTISFINRSVLPANGTATYEWTFYDADGKTILSTSNSENAKFIYEKYGRYGVKLVVKHSNGCVDSIVKKDLLTFEEIQINDITVTCDAGCIGKDLGIKVSQLPGCRDNMKISYEWIVYKKNSTEELTRLYGDHPNVKIYDTGSYDVKLILKNSEGCQVEKSMGGLLKIVIPKPEFTADTTQACIESGVTLSQKTSPEYLTYTHTWEITLSTDSTVKILGTGADFKPEFKQPGIYHVKYTAGFGDWCKFPLEKRNYLKISGIKADFTAEKTDGCLPFSTTLKASVLDNKHFINKSNIVKYEWRSPQNSGITFTDVNAAQTQVIFSKTGYYSVALIVTNSDGCTYTVTKNNFFVAGVIANFSVPSKSCISEKVQIVNNTSRNASAYKWSSNLAGVSFYPSANVKNPEIRFSKGGRYIIKLVSFSAEGCSDSTTRTVQVDQVKAKFSSNDTMNSCAPAYVSFQAYGTAADSFIWYFGDGEVLRTKDTNIAHIYRRNSGDMSTGYDVMLVVKSNFGCTDTLLKRKYIKVLGPVPAFSMSNNTGCEPLLVSFNNQSKFTQKYYLDFGDFSKPDTTQFGPHVYRITDPNAEYQVFKPRLLAKDEFGCSVWAYAQDSIVVYRKPKADFSVKNATVCAGEAVEFSNNSTFAKKFAWDFNNDGKTDDTSRNPKAFLAAGIYGVRLTISNTYGCTDTFYMPNAITVYAKPQAVITTSADTVCAGGTAVFSIQNTGKVELTSYKWFINNQAVKGSASTLTKAFLAPGIYGVSAEIESVNGCKTMVDMGKKILVPDTAVPVAPAINFVTVEADTFVKIQWNRSNDVFFKKYKLYRKEGNEFKLIFSAQNASVTEYIDKNTSVKKQNYSYRLVVDNYCGKSSKPTEVHTSVLLKVIANGNNRLQLNWSRYKGWSKVREYVIYRSEGSEYAQLAKVNGADSQYVDAGLCDQTYKYYVVAVGENAYTSWSNTSAGKPKYIYNTAGEDVRFATVTGDEKVLVNWQKKEHENPKAYIIDRFEPGKGWTNNYAYTTENQFIDENADVYAKNYAYRISVEDRCGKITLAGNIGTSILLKATEQNDNVLLQWTGYRGWDAGVLQYRIEIKSQNCSWQLVNTVSGRDTTYTDTEAHLEINGPYIYRIVAEESAFEAAQSVSNLAKVVLPSRLFIPNAFTPNQDGHNDEFKPVSRFIHEQTGNNNHNYSMSIYNRWGEKIFESNSLDKGWDGKFKGVEAQQDTYMYIINAFGYDKQRYYVKGSFDLLR